MKINLTRKATHAVIALEGAIDGRTAPEAQAAITPILGEFAVVILDLTQVNYMSSAGLRVLLLIHRQLAAKKGRAILVGLSDGIAETMRVTGFLQFFETRATLAEVQI